MEVKPIDCSHCNALCCRVIGKIIPEYDRGDCACIHLTEDNKCEIYNDRPPLCNTVHIYNKYYKDKLTIEQWNEINRQACETLRDEAEIVRKEPIYQEESKTE